MTSMALSPKLGSLALPLASTAVPSVSKAFRTPTPQRPTVSQCRIIKTKFTTFLTTPVSHWISTLLLPPDPLIWKPLSICHHLLFSKYLLSPFAYNFTIFLIYFAVYFVDYLLAIQGELQSECFRVKAKDREIMTYFKEALSKSGVHRWVQEYAVSRDVQTQAAWWYSRGSSSRWVVRLDDIWYPSNPEIIWVLLSPFSFKPSPLQSPVYV